MGHDMGDNESRLQRAARRTAHLARLIVGPIPTRLSEEGSGGDFERFYNSWTIRQRLAVPTGFSESSPYASEDDNIAVRIWHDTIHAIQCLEFTIADELTVSSLMKAAARRHAEKVFAHLSPLDIADIVRFVEIDNGGQTLYYRKHGEFPKDQTAFTEASWKHGLAYTLATGEKF